MKRLILSTLDEINLTKLQDVEFIGPCCLMNHPSQDDLLHKINSDKTFGDWAELKEASDYVIDYCERLIVVLTKELNKHHQTDFSVKYWRILLMPWLVSAIQIFYERYKRLEKRFEDGQAYKLTLVGLDSIPPIMNTVGFLNFIQHPETNHYLYSLFLDQYEDEQRKVESYQCINLSSIDHFKYSKHSKFNYFKRDIWRQLQRVFSLVMSRFSGFYLDGVYGINQFDNIYLSLKSRSKTQNSFDFDEAISSIDKVERKKTETLKISVLTDSSVRKNAFEIIIAQNLLVFLPNTVLSAYPDYLSLTRKFIKKLSRNVHTLVLGPLLGGYEPMKFITALFVECGGRLIISQHGSNYGYLESFPKMSLIEYKPSDLFLTWGWQEQADYEIRAKPLASPLLSKISAKGTLQDKGHLTLISTFVPLVAKNLASEPEPNDAVSYRQAKINFLGLLHEEILQQVHYRPYFTERAALPDRDYIKTLFPSIQIIENNLIRAMRCSRCVVIDHPGTSMLEAFAMNIPTVLFWDQEHWALCSQALPCFNQLQDAKILHTSTQSATDFINRNWHDGRSWWLDENVQKARKQFCDAYALHSSNWKQDWVKFLQKLDTIDIN